MSGIIKKRGKNRARRADRKALKAAKKAGDYLKVVEISTRRGWAVQYKKV